MAALDAIDAYRNEGATFRAWLFRIAHNQLANALRARGRHRTTDLDDVPEPVATTATRRDWPASPTTPGGCARRRLLSDERRQVVVLRFVDGLSAREIGAWLERTRVRCASSSTGRCGDLQRLEGDARRSQGGRDVSGSAVLAGR